ncbi:50S ribosomal protein L33 [Myxococcus fulvus 124B02]|nr:50S ribosomal protein L33 [Myxococcus fulvus 124B02]
MLQFLSRNGFIMPKGNRTIVHLVSTAKTGYFYTTTKNKRKSQDKLQLKKYDPRVRKHVLFVEGKP